MVDQKFVQYKLAPEQRKLLGEIYARLEAEGAVASEHNEPLTQKRWWNWDGAKFSFNNLEYMVKVDGSVHLKSPKLRYRLLEEAHPRLAMYKNGKLTRGKK